MLVVNERALAPFHYSTTLTDLPTGLCVSHLRVISCSPEGRLQVGKIAIGSWLRALQKFFHAKKSPQKRTSTGASLAEFGPVLAIFVLLVFIPALNFLSFAWGYATANLTCQACAADAANAPSFDQALAAVKKRARDMLDSAPGRFAGLKTASGYEKCGFDLYLAESNVQKETTGQFYGPNTGLPRGAKIDNAANVYEYALRGNFDVGPFLNLSAVPLVSNLPLIGQPVKIELSSIRVAEHTDCLRRECP